MGIQDANWTCNMYKLPEVNPQQDLEVAFSEQGGQLGVVDVAPPQLQGVILGLVLVSTLVTVLGLVAALPWQGQIHCDMQSFQLHSSHMLPNLLDVKLQHQEAVPLPSSQFLHLHLLHKLIM